MLVSLIEELIEGLTKEQAEIVISMLCKDLEAHDICISHLLEHAS